MVAITRAPGCFRWFSCCGRFRVNARKVRSIVEGDICQGVFGGVVNHSGKSGLPIDSKTVERTHAQISECLQATNNKGTSRRGVLQRYSAAGFVRYNVPNRGGLAAQNGFANVGIVEELGDDNYGDQDLARNVVAAAQRKRVIEKRNLYSSDSDSQSGLVEDEQGLYQPAWETFTPEFLPDSALPMPQVQQKAFNSGGYKAPDISKTVQTGAPKGWDSVNVALEA
eukprot:g16677.t1